MTQSDKKGLVITFLITQLCVSLYNYVITTGIPWKFHRLFYNGNALLCTMFIAIDYLERNLLALNVEKVYKGYKFLFVIPGQNYAMC